MLDTLRSRLTLWYSLVLAVFLVLFSFTSYLLFSRAADRHTDADLEELANSFLVTFQDELKDPDNPGGLQAAARQTMLEHRVRDNIFFIVDAGGKVVARSGDMPSSSGSVDSMVAGVLASEGFAQFCAIDLATEPQLPEY